MKRRQTQKRASSRRTRRNALASVKVGESVHNMKLGKLRAGRSRQPVKTKAQAIAIGLSEARRAGATGPRRRRGKNR